MIIYFLKLSQEIFWKNAKKWQVYTDKLIYLISKQIELIEKNIWKNMNFENIYSQKVINWKIIKFEKEIIYLDSWQGELSWKDKRGGPKVDKLILDEWRVFK